MFSFVVILTCIYIIKCVSISKNITEYPLTFNPYNNSVGYYDSQRNGILFIGGFNRDNITLYNLMTNYLDILTEIQYNFNVYINGFSKAQSNDMIYLYPTEFNETLNNGRIYLFDTENLEFNMDISIMTPNMIYMEGSCLIVIAGYLYLIGGITYNDSYSNTVFIYDIMGNIWVDTNITLNVPRVFHFCINVDDILYVIGGETNNGLTDTIETINITKMDSIFTIYPATLKYPRKLFHVIKDADNYLYIMSGISNDGSMVKYIEFLEHGSNTTQECFYNLSDYSISFYIDNEIYAFGSNLQIISVILAENTTLSPQPPNQPIDAVQILIVVVSLTLFILVTLCLIYFCYFAKKRHRNNNIRKIKSTTENDGDSVSTNSQNSNNNEEGTMKPNGQTETITEVEVNDEDLEVNDIFNDDISIDTNPDDIIPPKKVKIITKESIEIIKKPLELNITEPGTDSTSPIGHNAINDNRTPGSAVDSLLLSSFPDAGLQYNKTKPNPNSDSECEYQIGNDSTGYLLPTTYYAVNTVNDNDDLKSIATMMVSKRHQSGTNLDSFNSSDGVVRKVVLDKDVKQININELDMHKSTLLGSGHFGNVYLAEWNFQKVAVKRLKKLNESTINPNKWDDNYDDTDMENTSLHTNNNLKEIYAEIYLANKIPFHPNLIKIWGIVLKPLCMYIYLI